MTWAAAIASLIAVISVAAFVITWRKLSSTRAAVAELEATLEQAVQARLDADRATAAAVRAAGKSSAGAANAKDEVFVLSETALSMGRLDGDQDDQIEVVSDALGLD